MSLGLIVSLFTTVLFAFPQVPAAPDQSGTIEGRVVSLAGQALRKTTVYVQAAAGVAGEAGANIAAQPSNFAVTTDAAGNFRFDAVEPGRYTLLAKRSGYVRQFYGARAPLAGGLALSLGAGGSLTGLTIMMTPQGIITGQVEDEDGEAFSSAQVTAYKLGYQGGIRHLVFAGNGVVNPDGTFMVGNLAPGSYYLSASDMRPTMNGVAERPGSRAPVAGHVPSYYPSAAEPSAAMPIDVTAGAFIDGIGIRLIQARLYQVRGKVTGQTTGTLVPNLSLVRTGGLPQFSQPVTVQRDGSFAFTGLAPGSYVIRTTRNGPANPEPASSLIGYARVTIIDQDLDGIAVPLGPGIDIAGTVTMEADPSSTQPEFKLNSQIILQPVDGNSGFGGLGAPVKDDGAFDFRGLVPERFRIDIAGQPPGSYVKQIQFEGLDITHDLLVLPSGSGGVLEILLCPKASSVFGAVRNENGDPMPNVPVTLWTPGQPASGVYDLPRNTNTDAVGGFVFDDLAPGEYRVAAWEEIEPGLAENPDFRARFEATAAKVVLRESSQATADMEVVSRDNILAGMAQLP